MSKVPFYHMFLKIKEFNGRYIELSKDKNATHAIRGFIALLGGVETNASRNIDAQTGGDSKWKPKKEPIQTNQKKKEPIKVPASFTKSLEAIVAEFMEETTLSELVFHSSASPVLQVRAIFRYLIFISDCSTLFPTKLCLKILLKNAFCLMTRNMAQKLLIKLSLIQSAVILWNKFSK